MSYWVLKTEPSTYSYDRLEQEKTAVWDGVSNPVAWKQLNQMQPGDEAIVYHTGAEKACVGLAAITSAAYPDPKAKDPKLVVVNLKAVGRLPKPVPLSTIKADAAFKDMALVRMGRLSVVPATAAQWRRLLQLGGL